MRARCRAIYRWLRVDTTRAFSLRRQGSITAALPSATRRRASGERVRPDARTNHLGEEARSRGASQARSSSPLRRGHSRSRRSLPLRLLLCSRVADINSCASRMITRRSEDQPGFSTSLAESAITCEHDCSERSTSDPFLLVARNPEERSPR